MKIPQELKSLNRVQEVNENRNCFNCQVIGLDFKSKSELNWDQNEVVSLERENCPNHEIFASTSSLDFLNDFSVLTFYLEILVHRLVPGNIKFFGHNLVCTDLRVE